MTASLRSAVGNTINVGFAGLEAPKPLLQAARAAQIAGVILFKRNIESVDQSRSLIKNVRTAFSDLSPFIAVDQEGGRVARFSNPVLKLPPMRKFGEHDDTELTRRAAQILAEQLAWIGINTNFAPILDVDSNPKNPIIGDRSFGRTVEQVVRHALAFAAGLSEKNILPVGKHFPGHGDTDLDSHLALPIVLREQSLLDKCELAPFFATLTTLPALMSAHVLFPALDAQRPATLSHRVMTELLRHRMKFEGVAVSDDLEMKAVRDQWGIVGAGVEAIGAGCDNLLVCSDFEQALELYAALVREAERSAIFRDRILESSHRVTLLRKKIVSPEKAAPSIPVDEARAFEDELRFKGLASA